MADQLKYPSLDPALDRDFDDRPAHAENPLLLVHRLLRGRYLLAIGLALVLGVVGAGAGYFAMKPMFRSEGLIRVQPTLPTVLYQTEESEVPPMFDSFVAAQQTFLRSPRVRDLAVQDPVLIEAGWPQGVAGAIKLQNQMAIPRRGRGEQVIQLAVEDQNPRLAQEAVNAVLRAYKRLYIDETGRAKTQRQEILEQRQATLQAELRTLRERISDLAEEFGADNLVRLHSAQVDELTELDAKLREIDVAIAEAESRRSQSGAGELVEPTENTASLELEALENMLAANDRALADFLAQERAMNRELASMRAAGFGDQHRALRDLQNRLAALRVQINDRVAFLQEQMGGQTPTLAGSGNASVEQLRALRATHQRLRDDALNRAEFLATRRRVINALQAEEAEKDQLLKDTRTALERIRVEQQQEDDATGRVTIASWGDLPVSPSSDKRLPAAAAGLAGGMGLGVGMVALFGLLNPSCRYVDDLEARVRTAPLLGTLPNLDSDDPEQDEMAALSVHQIRNVLELQHQANNSRARVFTITSATAGEGKTSLTMALAMSFAAAGERTLIVDADLIGRGVTKQLKLTDKPGLRECMESPNCKDAAHLTPVANLFAMPTGSLKDFQPKNLSRDRAATMFDHLRDTYDVVLVDTGPIMGSLEGNLVCALSDATVLVVTRGQRSKFVQASMARIANIGGHCAGTVFNRAAAEDYSRSVSHASFHVASVRSSQQPTPPNGKIIASRALVQAVAGNSYDSEDQS